MVSGDVVVLLLAPFRLAWETDSRPMKRALQPLFAASCRNSSSKAASRVAWLVHHRPSGAIASKSSLECLRFALMLSSQKTSALPGIPRTSSATSPTGRYRIRRLYMAGIVQ